MNITRLRTIRGITALKGENAFTAGHECKLRMLPCGHFLITRYGQTVIAPHSGVDYAECEYAEAVPGGGEQRARPKKEQASA